MSADIHIRVDGRAGRITLNRPGALNALTYDMCLKIEKALDLWAKSASVSLLILDAEGDKAFCAGGDIAEMYTSGTKGDFDYGRRFWADEYRMNAKLFNFPKPVVSFLQGFTMGGGVGVGCHASHRIVGESSRIAMPEVGIGLVPDVGGSLLLARAPGRLGEFLGTTGHRMGPGDAILAEFADYYIPESDWSALKIELVNSGDWEAVDRAAKPAPEASLAAHMPEIDRAFSGDGPRDVLNTLASAGTEFADKALTALRRNSPLSVVCTLDLVRRVRALDTIEHALEHEYRFTYRAMEQGDFLEGIRAAIIDKDRTPRWRHGSIEDVPAHEASAMMMPLDGANLTF